MKPTIFTCSGFIQLLALALQSKVEAHTWVEQLMRIAPNGTFVGTPGYPRGFVPRSDTNVNDAMVWKLLGPANNALMCKPSQSIGNQTPGYPALIASPGDQIALRYEENGHVTLPELTNRPEGSGTVFVYGTENPKDTDTYDGIHRVWNTAGTGGDERGVLLATRHFDDGQCYQENNSPISVARQAEFPHNGTGDLLCQTDIQIPVDATGNYTMYWVWEWPSLDEVTGAVEANETYTTCMGIVLNPSTGNSKAEAVSFKSGQAFDSVAIAAQMSTAFLVNPTASEQPFVAGSAPAPFTGSVATPSGAPASAQAPNSLSVTIPTASPGVQLSTTAHPSAASSQHSTAAGGMVTVTVTATPVEETVTVTKTVDGGAKSTAKASAGVQSPATSGSAGNAPPLIPFLAPGGATTAPIQVSTQAPSSTSAAYKPRGRFVR